MRRGQRLDQLAAVLPDPAGWEGAASHDADEADHPVRGAGGGRAERGAVGQSRRGKLLRTARVRADTTVICANVAYPTDSGLLAKAVGKLVRTARRVQAAGGATATVMTDRRRAAARRVREIASKLRGRGKLSREESTQAICRVTGELAGLAQKTAAEAAAVLRNGRRAVPKALTGRMRGRLVRALGELAVTIERTAQVVAQTRSRLAGQLPAKRDPAGQPARPRRPADPQGPHRPPGRVRVQGPGHRQRRRHHPGLRLEYGAAPDGPQLAPAVARIRRRTGRVPRAVTADRGYGHAAVERDLHELGVRTVAIPRQATTSAARKKLEHSRGFRELVKWRTGCEGRISYLKQATAGTAPTWTAGTEPRSGAGTGSSPTTWSRSQPWQDDQPHTKPPVPPSHPGQTSARRLFQVEVAKRGWACVSRSCVRALYW